MVDGLVEDRDPRPVGGRGGVPLAGIVEHLRGYRPAPKPAAKERLILAERLLLRSVVVETRTLTTRIGRMLSAGTNLHA
jgi:hypothetical protein